MNNGDTVVDDERQSVALVSMQAIVTSLIALFLQAGFTFPPPPAHCIAPTRVGVRKPQA
jgi:hypothetical protein